MPEENLFPNIANDAKKMSELIEKREKETEENDEKSYSSRSSINYSGDKWKEEVINHYKKLHGEFRILRSINHSIGIEIINPIETPYFRCYTILTPWVLDPIIEFMVDLDEKQKRTAKNFDLTNVGALTNEKSRWVRAGTSLVDQHSHEQLIKIGSHWSNDLLYDGFRIIFAHTHL